MFNLKSFALRLALAVCGALNLNSSFILIMEWTGYWGNFKSESNTFDGKFVWKQLCTSKGNGGPTTCTHTKVQTGNPHRGVWMIDIRGIGLQRECICGNICLSNFQFAKIHFSIYFHVKDSKLLCIRFHFNWHDVVWLARPESFLWHRICVHTSCSQSFLCFICASTLELYRVVGTWSQHVWSKNLNWMWLLRQTSKQANQQVK